jgi:molybdopterin/thiamine biosynthesis adenylyltransferase
MAKGHAPWQAAYAAMVERNIGIVSEAEQERLRTATCALPGLGGLGGVALEVLVRSGVGNFRVVDKDTFEPSNLNRQLLAVAGTLGRRKIDVAEERARTINPDVTVRKWEHVDEDNVGEVLDGADVVVQAIDQLRPCLVVARKARELGIPLVEGWAIPFANVRVFTRQTPTLEEAYGLPTADRAVADIGDDELRRLQTDLLFGLRRIQGVDRFYSAEALDRIRQGRIPSFAPMVWFTAVLMAVEALKVLLEWGAPALAPAFALYDPFEHRIPEVQNEP